MQCGKLNNPKGNNMDKILSAFQDGNGQTSMMRVVMFVVVGAVIGSKFFNSWITKTPIVWDAQDLMLIGSVISGKLIQNSQENPTPTVNKTN